MRPLNLAVRSAVSATTSICDIVESWLEENAGPLGWRAIRLGRDHERGTLAARYELPGALVSISAWEQGFSLDVDVLVRATGTVQMLYAGPCVSSNVAIGRLSTIAAQVADYVRI